MFELPTAPRPPAPKRTPAANAKPVWTIYRPKVAVPCDHCKQVQAEREGDAPLARKARHRRKAGGTDLLLCGPHAQEQRARDGMPVIKERRSR
jgi:hypothetical protein